jgi:hypothetical protein
MLSFKYHLVPCMEVLFKSLAAHSMTIRTTKLVSESLKKVITDKTDMRRMCPLKVTYSRI